MSRAASSRARREAAIMSRESFEYVVYLFISSVELRSFAMLGATLAVTKLGQEL